jgi:hypothetical protein
MENGYRGEVKVMRSTFKQFLMYDELKAIVGENNLTDLGCDLDSYSLDGWWPSRVWMNKGVNSPRPDVIVFPQSTEQVSQVVKFANRNGVQSCRAAAAPEDLAAYWPLTAASSSTRRR